MKTLEINIRKIEFEGRIFVSFGIVLLVTLVSIFAFPGVPSTMAWLGQWAGLPAGAAVMAGYFMVAAIMIVATLLRMWAGTILTSPRVMAFRVQSDTLAMEGPYKLTRNPIYLADLIAFTGFALCLTPVGFAMPVLLYIHYNQLISYEEANLGTRYGTSFHTYKSSTPRLLPNMASLRHLAPALAGFRINRDGFRHNALYLFFIPGFVFSAFTGSLGHAVLLGLPAVVDWAVVHTRIGLDPEAARSKKRKSGRTLSKLKRSKVFADVLYAQCWEDPEIDRKAFEIAPQDVIFSITSGGCNLLAFLADNPKKVIALDISPWQNHMLELKIAAFRELEYEALLAFFGVRESDCRWETYMQLRRHLSQGASAYWDGQEEKIIGGIIHSGRYERYMHLLKKGLDWMVGKNLALELFACGSDDERRQLFEDKWNNIRWRTFTKLFLSRRLMSLLFTGKFFKQLEESFSFGEHFRGNVKKALTELPLHKNHFLAYALLGHYLDEDHLPVYLRRENFNSIRQRLDRVEIISDSCEHYFSTLPAGSITKFNYSNIFEWMDPAAFENLLKETIRLAGNGAVITYRNLLVPRSRPESLARWIRPQKEMSEQLHNEDLSFIYRAYIVEHITKTA